MAQMARANDLVPPASHDERLAMGGRSFSPSMDLNPTVFSSENATLLGALTVAAATISILAGSLSLFWFIRMRKAFRHHLIMLLILSNLWRAIWYFVFPIVSFARGTTSSASPFCQVSGFMLSYGIEGADIAVLVMAIHAALCIFRTSAALGEGGLYPVRHLVYAIWVLLPALAAGLAFVNREGAYVSLGAYCYLPVRPFWYRLALSWIPRYLILICIASIYLAIYLFVRRNFHHYNVSKHSSDKLPSGDNDRRPPGPVATKRSESDATSSRFGALLDPCIAQPSRGVIDVEKSGQNRALPAWENYTFGAASPLAKPEEDETVTTESSFLKVPKPSNSHHPRGSTASRESNTYIIEALRDSQPGTATNCNTPGSTVLRLTDSNDETIEDTTMRARYRQIKRQMRFLFVYPVVYLITWIIPFVAHCLNYSDQYARNPNFGLTAAATVILSLQCAIDTILFTTREKPWRASDTDDPHEQTVLGSLVPRCARRYFSPRLGSDQRGGSDSTARRSLIGSAAHTASAILRIRGSHGGDEQASNTWRRTQFHSSGAKVSGGGRSHGQHAVEARLAQERKNVETTQARESAGERLSQRKESLARRGGRDRSWWEVEGRQRKDSVWLGTDNAGDQALSASAARRKNGGSMIGEEPEPLPQDVVEGSQSEQHKTS